MVIRRASLGILDRWSSKRCVVLDKKALLKRVKQGLQRSLLLARNLIGTHHNCFDIAIGVSNGEGARATQGAGIGIRPAIGRH